MATRNVAPWLSEHSEPPTRKRHRSSWGRTSAGLMKVCASCCPHSSPCAPGRQGYQAMRCDGFWDILNVLAVNSFQTQDIGTRGDSHVSVCLEWAKQTLIGHYCYRVQISWFTSTVRILSSRRKAKIHVLNEWMKLPLETMCPCKITVRKRSSGQHLAAAGLHTSVANCCQRHLEYLLHTRIQVLLQPDTWYIHKGIPR